MATAPPTLRTPTTATIATIPTRPRPRRRGGALLVHGTIRLRLCDGRVSMMSRSPGRRRPVRARARRARTQGATPMKYLLMIYMNPAVFEGLSEDEQQAVMDGHDGFIKTIE